MAPAGCPVSGYRPWWPLSNVFRSPPITPYTTAVATPWSAPSPAADAAAPSRGPQPPIFVGIPMASRISNASGSSWPTEALVLGSASCDQEGRRITGHHQHRRQGDPGPEARVRRADGARAWAEVLSELARVAVTVEWNDPRGGSAGVTAPPVGCWAGPPPWAGSGWDPRCRSSSCASPAATPRWPWPAPSPKRFPPPCRITLPFLSAAYTEIGVAASHIEQLTGQPAERVLLLLHPRTGQRSRPAVPCSPDRRRGSGTGSPGGYSRAAQWSPRCAALFWDPAHLVDERPRFHVIAGQPIRFDARRRSDGG